MKQPWVKRVLATGVGFLALQVSAQDKPALVTPADKVSYAIGVDLARNFKRQGIECNLDLLIEGFKHGMAGERLLLRERELRQLLIQVQTEVRQKQALIRGKTPAEINLRRGEAFLSKNRTQPGVVGLTNGLQYIILKAGHGRTPTDADTVQCDYRCTVLDGTEFISSEVGKPATFKVQEAVVRGWTDALKLMPVGSKWRLFIPPQLAYGAQGVGREVGPNETIISELELLAIQ